MKQNNFVAFSQRFCDLEMPEIRSGSSLSSVIFYPRWNGKNLTSAFCSARLAKNLKEKVLEREDLSFWPPRIDPVHLSSPRCFFPRRPHRKWIGCATAVASPTRHGPHFCPLTSRGHWGRQGKKKSAELDPTETKPAPLSWSWQASREASLHLEVATKHCVAVLICFFSSHLYVWESFGPLHSFFLLACQGQCQCQGQ